MKLIESLEDGRLKKIFDPDNGALLYRDSLSAALNKIHFLEKDLAIKSKELTDYKSIFMCVPLHLQFRAMAKHLRTLRQKASAKR